jgi:hypothetical protein
MDRGDGCVQTSHGRGTLGLAGANPDAEWLPLAHSPHYNGYERGLLGHVV